MIRRSYLNNVADANVSILVASRENYLQKVKESNQQSLLMNQVSKTNVLSSC